MEYVWCENKTTGKAERYVKIYYVDEYGFDHIKSYNKDDELFEGHKIDYYLKRSRCKEEREMSI